MKADHATITPLAAEGLTLAYDKLEVVARPRLDDPAPAGSPASSAPTPAASRPCCGRSPGCSSPRRRGPPRRPGHPHDADQGGRHQARHPAADPVAPEGITVADLVCAGPAPAPDLVAAVVGRADEQVVAEAMRVDRHGRARRPAGRRAVRRAAATRLDRDGPGAGHRPDAPRRADDVPRPGPPDRRARPARRPQPHATAAPSCSSCTTSTRPPLRRPPDRHEGRRGRRVGRPGRGRSPRSVVADVFGLPSRVVVDEVSGTPLVLPIGRHHAPAAIAG